MTLALRGAVGLVASCLLYGAGAHAQAVDDATRGAARQLGEDGVIAYENSDFSTASQKLEKGWSLLKVPVIGLWSARALVKSGKLVEGYERYLETTRLAFSGGDAALQEKAKADAATEADQLRARVPKLVVLVEGAPAADVEVRVDGLPVASALIGEARPINPGRHIVEGTRGSQRVSVRVELAEAATETAKLVLTSGAAAGAPVPPRATNPSPGAATPAPTLSVAAAPNAPTDRASGSWQRTVGFVGLGLGGVGVGLGVVGAVIASSKKTNLDDSGQCDSDYRCFPSQSDTVSSYNSMRTLSSVGFIAGGVLAATGLVLVLTAPRDERPVSLGLAPGSVQLHARF